MLIFIKQEKHSDEDTMELGGDKTQPSIGISSMPNAFAQPVAGKHPLLSYCWAASFCLVTKVSQQKKIRLLKLTIGSM